MSLMDKFELQKLRELPIEAVAERLGLQVSRHKCLCPFHADNHPSLSFRVSKNTYRCFVCGASGDNISLVEKVLGKSFPDACRWLADENNIILNEWKPKSTQKEPSLLCTFDASRYVRYFERPWLLPENDTVDRLIVDSGNEYGLFKYMYEEAHYPVYDGCGLEYYPFGQNKFEALLRELRNAERFIFLEYFIIGKGEMWGEVLKILRQKVKEGVEVRVLYDGTNTMLRLPKSYPNVLRAWGIDCRVFSPMKPVITTHQNFRDHRKIVVIDGHTAFTGGVNLADEYINRTNRFGVWKDSAVMVKGKAVNSFTLMFLQMWNMKSTDPEYYSRYMFKGMEHDENVSYGGYVVPYGDNPLDDEEVGKKVYLDILNRANKYVHIMTPYLILDEEMTNSLVFAAQR